MVRKWMTWINYFACGIIALLLLAALGYYLMRQTTFSMNEDAARKLEVPKGTFARQPQEYEAIGAPALTLVYSPLSVQLPDLRRHLVYYGKNGRPDAKDDIPALFFSFTGNRAPTPLASGERLYLFYDKKLTPPQYVFSENNQPNSIWMEATSQGNQALVKVSMLGDNDQVITEPASYADFSLPEKELVRFGGTVWELGKWRVDGTLLARQKARWFGIDKFLEKHGGEEYKDLTNKQRIDFGENDEIYSVFVGLGDCLIWVDGKWQAIRTGEASIKHTLMCIKKIDERVLTLELWDVEGKGKITLNLVKANEAWVPQNLEQNFKFVGARTRSQFVFEINRERMMLRPYDWLLFTQDAGWKKLTNPQQIDDYVERRTVGPLFVFDKVDRKDDRQVIMGTLFNSARTEMVSFELPLQQAGSSGPQGAPGGPNDKRLKPKEGNIPATRIGNFPHGMPAQNNNVQKMMDPPRANIEEHE